MNRKTVIKTSLFYADKKDFFKELQKLKTLQYIAFPYAVFEPTDGNADLVWTEGKCYSFKLRLFGVIPFGEHKIRIIEFDEEKGIYTEESNKYVPVWNHRILLKTADDNFVEYTDKVEIGAGWKTLFVYLWAKAFYAHRQRKWRKILKKDI